MRCQGLLRLSLLAAVLAIAASIKHLQIAKLKEIKEEDCPRKSKAGDKITVDYHGTLKDGTVFESSAHEDHRDPATFMLGRGEVIEGWEQGLLDMCVGEKRKLSVPPEMAYGDTGQRHHKEEGTGKIPRGATVYFEVELLKIEDGSEEIDVFKNIDINGDDQLSQDEVKEFLKEYIPREFPDQADLYTGEWGLKKASNYIFRDVDMDEDGIITYEEYVAKHLRANADRSQHDEL